MCVISLAKLRSKLIEYQLVKIVAFRMREAIILELLNNLNCNFYLISISVIKIVFT